NACSEYAERLPPCFRWNVPGAQTFKKEIAAQHGGRDKRGREHDSGSRVLDNGKEPADEAEHRYRRQTKDDARPKQSRTRFERVSRSRQPSKARKRIGRDRVDEPSKHEGQKRERQRRHAWIDVPGGRDKQ